MLAAWAPQKSPCVAVNLQVRFFPFIVKTHSLRSKVFIECGCPVRLRSAATEYGYRVRLPLTKQGETEECEQGTLSLARATVADSLCM